MYDHVHQTFMRLALSEAEQALAANEFPVGCVIVHHGEVVARGHRTNSRTGTANELDHAEVAALRELLSARPEIDRPGLTVYSTMEPCLMCYATLLLNGVRTIAWAYEDAMGGGTGLDLDSLPPLYREMRPTLIGGVLRAESLALFQRFFLNPDNDYWQGSLLADYTLRQQVGNATATPTPS